MADGDLVSTASLVFNSSDYGVLAVVEQKKFSQHIEQVGGTSKCRLPNFSVIFLPLYQLLLKLPYSSNMVYVDNDNCNQ